VSKNRGNTNYVTIFAHYETEKKLQGVTTTTEQAGDIVGNNSSPWGITCV
jgi:hypothetical protein